MRNSCNDIHISFHHCDLTGWAAAAVSLIFLQESTHNLPTRIRDLSAKLIKQKECGLGFFATNDDSFLLSCEMLLQWLCLLLLLHLLLLLMHLVTRSYVSPSPSRTTACRADFLFNQIARVTFGAAVHRIALHRLNSRSSSYDRVFVRRSRCSAGLNWLNWVLMIEVQNLIWQCKLYSLAESLICQSRERSEVAEFRVRLWWVIARLSSVLSR